MSNPGIVPGIGKNPRRQSINYGLLVNRPAPSGSGLTYFATDDAYGTEYVDLVSAGVPTWVALAPRGLLASATMTVTSDTLNTSGGIVVANNVTKSSGTLAMSVAVTASTRPLKISLTTIGISTGTAPQRVIVGVYYYPTSAGSGSITGALLLQIGTSGTTASLGLQMSGSVILGPATSPALTPGINYTFTVAAQGGATATLSGAGPSVLTVEEV